MDGRRTTVRDLPSAGQTGQGRARASRGAIPQKPHHNLGNSIAIAALTISLITWIIVPSLVEKGVALLSAAMLLTYLAYRSHFVRTWPSRRKHLVAVMLVAVLVAVAAAQLIPQWKSERETKLGKLRGNITAEPTKDLALQANPRDIQGTVGVLEGGTVALGTPVHHRTAKPKKSVAPAETASTAPVAAPGVAPALAAPPQERCNTYHDMQIHARYGMTLDSSRCNDFDGGIKIDADEIGIETYRPLNEQTGKPIASPNSRQPVATQPNTSQQVANPAPQQ